MSFRVNPALPRGVGPQQNNTPTDLTLEMVMVGLILSSDLGIDEN